MVIKQERINMQILENLRWNDSCWWIIVQKRQNSDSSRTTDRNSKRLHTGHMGFMEKTKQIARNIVFRPNMNRDIDKMILQCKTCLDFRIQNFCVDAIPYEPWQIVGTHLFSLHVHGGDYSVVKDYSRFILKLWNSLTHKVTQL